MGGQTQWNAILPILAGALGFGVGIHEAIHQSRLRRRGIRVRGRVVGHSVHRTTKGIYRMAVIEFTDARGVRHTMTPKSSGVRGLPVGGEVPVRYLPGIADHARIDLTAKRIEEIAVCFAFGSLFAGLGIWLLVTRH